MRWYKMSLSVSNLLSWARENTAYLILAFAIVLFLLLRTSPTEGVDSLDTLEATLNTGQPVVLEFYSNL